MSYGMQFVNSGNVTTLDSEFSRLSIMSSGRFTPGADGFNSYTNFVRPVTTQEPPLVFVKMDRVSGSMGFGWAQVQGAAGNWTGFSMIRYSINTAPLSGEYFAAAFQAAPVARYGFRLWDASAKLIADSGTPSALFTSGSAAWYYVTASKNSQGQDVITFATPYSFSTSDFLLLNNFGMDVAGARLRSANLYCLWNFSTGQLNAVTIGTTNVVTLYIPAIFARLSNN